VPRSLNPNIKSRTQTAALKPLLIKILAVGIAISAVTARGATGGFDFSSGIAAYDQAYQKARRVLAADVQDGKFLAGQNWQQVWTRDTSYSVEMACALLHPDVSKTTLLGLTQAVDGIGECWYQDKCGHFAGWPNLTDAIVGASGSWALYLVTGDRELLRPIYDRTVRSLKRAERDAFDPKLGLFRGCASFMESNSGYPKDYAMKGEKVGKTCALSTCLLYIAATSSQLTPAKPWVKMCGHCRRKPPLSRKRSTPISGNRTRAITAISSTIRAL